MYSPTPEDRKAYEDMSVVICTPCKDYSTSFRFSRCVGSMIAYSWMHGLKVYEWGGTERQVVHWARNELAKLVKDAVNPYTGKRYTHILWLDDDHVFNPDLAVYLARYRELDMVSALYYGRVGRHLPVVYVKDKDDGKDKYYHYPLIEVPPALVEVDAVGFGACLMRVDLLDRFEAPWFKFNNSGEDVYFCVHAKEVGAKIWCDGAYKLGHIGEPQIVTEATYRQFLEDRAEEYSDRVKVRLGGRDG